MKKLDIVAAVLVAVGGINWGLIALAEFDLVATLVGLEFGEVNAASRRRVRARRHRGRVPDRPAARDPPPLEPRPPRRDRVMRRAMQRLHPPTPTEETTMPSSYALSRRTVGIAGAAGATIAAVGLALGFASAPATAAPNARQNIVSTAASAGQFDTLLTLAKKAGLVGALSGSGPLTVFAPTDAAFRAVPKATLAKLANDKAALRRVLLYHVVKGNVTAARVVKLRSATTLAGPSIGIRVSGGNVFLNGSTKVVKTDIAASNGTIHVINKVLLPPAK